MAAIAAPVRIQIPQRVTGSFQYRPSGSPLAGAAAAPAPGTGLLTPAQIAQQVALYKSQLPAPLTDTQIQSRAQGELDPLVAKLTAGINAQAKNAGAAISGYTGSLAQALGGEDFGAPYQGAEQQQAAVDSALAQALAGGGTQGAADLSSRLASIGEPGVTGAAANAVAATGTGNSNTVLGMGSSSLSQLIADAAAAKSYGQKLPGLAQLSGLQDLAGVQQSAVKNISDQTGTLEGQLPNLVNQLRNQSDTRATNRATLGAKIDEYLTGQNAATAAGTAKAAQVNQQLYIEAKKLGLVAQNQTFEQWLKTQQLGQTAAKTAASIRQGDQRLAQGSRRLTIDQQVADAGTLRAAISKYKTINPAAKTLSAEQTQRYEGLANTIAGFARNGNPNYVNPATKQVEPLPPVSYGEALNEMLQGSPSLGAVPLKTALKALNAKYPPGVQGRPLGKGVYGPSSPINPETGKPVAK
jgi:hypothetical protein